jgi:hypothetical protein
MTLIDDEAFFHGQLSFICEPLIRGVTHKKTSARVFTKVGIHYLA